MKDSIAGVEGRGRHESTSSSAIAVVQFAFEAQALEIRPLELFVFPRYDVGPAPARGVRRTHGTRGEVTTFLSGGEGGELDGQLESTPLKASLSSLSHVQSLDYRSHLFKILNQI